MPTEIRAFQIFYDDETRAALDGRFEPLDNSAGERPDWYEYWPIRNYLRANELRDGVFYGFFPRGSTRRRGWAPRRYWTSRAPAATPTW